MDLVDRLLEEHRLITDVVAAFEVYVDAVDLEKKVEQHDLFRFVTFFSDFADNIHHAKEETVLFPALERHGFAATVGPLTLVRKQHSQERVLYAELKRAATDRHAWTTSRIGELVRSAHTLIHFERAHVEEENSRLLPAARVELANEDPEVVAKSLERFERIHSLGGYADYLRRLADELIVTYVPEGQAARKG